MIDGQRFVCDGVVRGWLHIGILPLAGTSIQDHLLFRSQSLLTLLFW